MDAAGGGNLPGRGAVGNPANRFESLSWHREDWSDEDPAAATLFLKDRTRSIINYNESPDVGFDASVNPYRGCEHGCAYCFARPNHEYLGFSAGLDFESRIMVKEAAALLLREELSKVDWQPQPIAMSGVTDPYQPIERRLGITRSCLEVLEELRNPVVIITKSDLVSRDVDILRSMRVWAGCVVFVSMTTLDREISRKMEPRAVTPVRRLEAIRSLSDAGVPVGVLAAPVVPGLTDQEIPAILAAAAAGASFAGHIPLRLPYGVVSIFEDWIELHFPLRKQKILSRIRSVRGGRMNDPAFRTRMLGEGAYAQHMQDLFDLGRRRAQLDDSPPHLSISRFRSPSQPQGFLFG